MRALCLILAMLIVLTGCTSVPRVGGATLVEKNAQYEKYNIKISKDYVQNPEEFNYAVNSWVMAQGGESYDVEREIKGAVTDINVIIPGSQSVRDLPQVKHFHRGKTVAAIVVPIGGVTVVSLFVWLFVSLAHAVASLY